MDKTHVWPFAAGFNARCEARTVAANAVVVGEYPVVSGPDWRLTTACAWYRAMRAAGHSHEVCALEVAESDAVDAGLNPSERTTVHA